MATSSTASDRGFDGPLEPVDDCTYRIPKSYKRGMLVDGLIFADERLLPLLKSERAAEQVVNVAFLPGIVRASLAMPDMGLRLLHRRRLCHRSSCRRRRLSRWRWL
jgi:hypothetical protein